MPNIIQGISKDILDSYEGYDEQKVGMGLINPNAYASDAYQKKKIKSIALGGISECRYAGFENDPNPVILTMNYIPAYNVVIGLNLRYGTPRLRQAILKYVLDTNKARIKSNLPIMVDYYSLKKAIPDSRYLVRMYKVVGLSPVKMFQLNEWPEVAAKKTPFDGFYTKFKKR